MKRLMVVGAGEVQLNLIMVAKDLGYYVTVCDMRDGTMAESLSDSYHKINYMDKEAVLQAAREERIDGIVSNSEPAMMTVAYVAKVMELPGNSPESVEKLLSKSKFRELQKSIGIYAPQYYIISTLEELLEKAKSMNYPIIIKPNQCSGTRGTKKIESFDRRLLEDNFQICKDFSRNQLVTIEEYVEMSSLRVNEADVFVLDNDFIWDGWVWADRSSDTPMLPMTNIFPMAMPYVVKDEIKNIVNLILKEAGIKLGEYNVETYYTPEGKLFVVEINPRQGGNYIPQLIEQHTGVSLTKLLVSTAVGDMSYYKELKDFKRENNYVTLQIVFSKASGILEDLYIDSSIQRYVRWVNQVIKPGEQVDKGINAGKVVAYVNLQFDDYWTQHHFTDNIEEYIYPILR